MYEKRQGIIAAIALLWMAIIVILFIARPNCGGFVYAENIDPERPVLKILLFDPSDPDPVLILFINSENKLDIRVNENYSMTFLASEFIKFVQRYLGQYYEITKKTDVVSEK